MPKLPRMSGAATIRALEKLGFARVRQRGSHVALKKVSDTGAIGCVVPLHRELAIGTLREILNQAQIDPETFKKKI